MTMAGSDRAVGGLLGGVLALLGRLFLVVAGAVFFVSALVAAVIASIVLLVWSLLTGRRPTLVQFPDGRWMFRTRRAAQQPPAGRPRGSGDVIDVDVREVPEVRGDSRRD
jgi:hypothetical protein